MRAFRTLIAATALVAIAAPAFAEPVLVVSRERIYAESLAGKDAQAKIKGIADTVRKELEPQGKALEAEQTGLGLANKTPQQIADEIQKNPTLKTKVGAYQQKFATLARLEEQRNAEIQATQNKAINDVLEAADPLVEQIRAQRQALVVLDANDVLKINTSVDITAEVITQLNNKTKAITVTKVDLSKQAQGQPQ